MKKTGIKAKSALPILFFVFFAGSALSAREPVRYQGVKPTPTGETEAALFSLKPADKCCDRQVNAQRDRSPHGLSPQEAHDLVKRTLTRRRAPLRPADDKSQKGSR